MTMKRSAFCLILLSAHEAWHIVGAQSMWFDRMNDGGMVTGSHREETQGDKIASQWGRGQTRPVYHSLL